MGQSAERPLKIHSAPIAHKPPKVGYAYDQGSRQAALPATCRACCAMRWQARPLASPGVAQPRRDTRHTDQQSLFQRAVSLIIT